MPEKHTLLCLNIQGWGSKCKFWGKNPQREGPKNKPPTLPIFRNLDNFFPGVNLFHSVALSLGKFWGKLEFKYVFSKNSALHPVFLE